MPEQQQQQQRRHQLFVVTTNTEERPLLDGPANDEPILLRHNSEFSVGSSYDDGSPNNLNWWQGAALLTADCLGTGLLALPADIHVLGYAWGLGFLIANLPINLFAGTILSHTASAIEDKQKVENRLFHETISGSILGGDDENVDYMAINQDTIDSKTSIITIDTSMTNHTQLHHDTATFDFIGLTSALFDNKRATQLVMLTYYTNIFLVLGNYILVMSTYDKLYDCWSYAVCLTLLLS